MAGDPIDLICALLCFASIQMNVHALEEFLHHNSDNHSETSVKHNSQFGQQRTLLKAENQDDDNGYVDSKIVFVSDDSDGDKQNYTPSTTSTCNNQTFCEDALDYPTEAIAVGLRMNKDLNWFSRTDIMPDVSHRINVPSDDVSLCESYEKVVYPKVAQSVDEKWLFIVNQEKFVQGVRVEICRSENTECNLITGFAEGYKTFCKQKFIYRQLAAVTSQGHIKPEMFRFPSSCCCHVKFTGNTLLRIATDIDKRNKHF